MKLHEKTQLLSFLLLTSLASFSSLHRVSGQAPRCENKGPSLQQREVSEGKFMVEVTNNCPMCPLINIHLQCLSFPQALVDPRLLRVVSASAGDCLVNGGLPLPPLHKFAFTYSSSSSSRGGAGSKEKKTKMYLLQPSSWSFQCE